MGDLGSIQSAWLWRPAPSQGLCLRPSNGRESLSEGEGRGISPWPDVVSRKPPPPRRVSVGEAGYSAVSVLSHWPSGVFLPTMDSWRKGWRHGVEARALSFGSV